MCPSPDSGSPGAGQVCEATPGPIKGLLGVWPSTGPRAQERPHLASCSAILKLFFNKGPKFSFCTGPHTSGTWSWPITRVTLTTHTPFI